MFSPAGRHPAAAAEAGLLLKVLQGLRPGDTTTTDAAVLPPTPAAAAAGRGLAATADAAVGVAAGASATGAAASATSVDAGWPTAAPSGSTPRRPR